MKDFYVGFITLLFFSSFLISCESTVSTAKKQPSLTAKLDSIGQHFIDRGQTGAISIAVNHNDSIIYNRAFGYSNLNSKQPISAKHYFNMASVSKLLGSVMVMRLVEEGKLSLDKTLAELLPEFPNPLQAQKITLRHLLSHTSGLIDYAIEIDTVYMKTGVSPTRSDYLNFFSKQDLLFEPGMYYAYTNSGFKLMEYIIEGATGRAFKTELDRIINKPTGLDIKLMAERIDNPLMTEALDYTDSILNEEFYWPWISGDGGMTATAKDLANFAQRWTDGTLISESSLNTMIKPCSLNSDLSTGYGLGTRTGYFEEEYAIGHTGGNKSAMAMMMYFPERDISLAVFDNTDGSPTSAMLIMGYVALAVLGKEEPVHMNLPLSEKLLSDYQGIYQMFEYVAREPNRLEVYLNEADGHLYRKHQASNSQGQKLVYLGNDLFATDPYVMDRIEFLRNSEGKVVAYRHYWNGLFQRMGFKKE